jgi:hypothetical protein
MVRETDEDAPEVVSEDNPFPVALRKSNPITQARAGQRSVSNTTPTLVVAENAKRTGLIITEVTGTFDVWLAPDDASVTAGTGHLLTGTKGASITITYRGAVYGIAPGGAQTVSFWEESES